jgi:hypothetical protein
MSGFLTGAGLERISTADYLAYDVASTNCTWRAPGGYGSLVAASLPRPIDLRLSTPVESIELDAEGVILVTPAGAIRARVVILRVSTSILAGAPSGCHVGSTRGETPLAASHLGATKSSSLRFRTEARSSLGHVSSETLMTVAPAATTSAPSVGL